MGSSPIENNARGVPKITHFETALSSDGLVHSISFFYAPWGVLGWWGDPGLIERGVGD